MSLKIVSCLLLTFPSLSHGVWIWKKSLLVHGGRSMHALDPSSKRKGEKQDIKLSNGPWK